MISADTLVQKVGIPDRMEVGIAPVEMAFAGNLLEEMLNIPHSVGSIVPDSGSIEMASENYFPSRRSSP